MLSSIVVGDIRNSKNKADIVIGMNNTLSDVTGMGRRFVNQYPTLIHPIDLGSVLSFSYDKDRYLHMIVCHKIGRGGWSNADTFIRFGMDYLWHSEPGRKFSIVQIGTGHIGLRDGADHVAIRTAMANSFLEVDLYVHDKDEQEAEVAVAELPLIAAHRAWHPRFGEQRLAA
jgi:hypothetical protein